MENSGVFLNEYYKFNENIDENQTCSNKRKSKEIQNLEKIDERKTKMIARG